MRRVRRVVAITLATVLSGAAAGCSGDSPDGEGAERTPVSAPPATSEPAVGPVDDGSLERACRAEGGRVSVIAADGRRPHMDELARRFEAATGVEVIVRRVDSDLASDESGVIAGGVDGSDAVELGLGALGTFRRQGLLAATPALPDESVEGIPAGLVDADEGWLSPWVSAVAFLVDPSVETAPTSFAELAAARWQTVGIVGDPVATESGLAVVVAASVAAGGSVEDAVPGIKWFAGLARRGRLVASSPDVLIGPADELVALRRSGAVDVAAVLVYPSDALVGRPAPVGALRGSPRPSCAARWLRWLVSADGAYVAGEGGSLPARWASPEALAGTTARIRLLQPPPEALGGLQVLTTESVAQAVEAVRETWRTQVGRIR